MQVSDRAKQVKKLESGQSVVSEQHSRSNTRRLITFKCEACSCLSKVSSFRSFFLFLTYSQKFFVSVEFRIDLSFPQVMSPVCFDLRCYPITSHFSWCLIMPFSPFVLGLVYFFWSFFCSPSRYQPGCSQQGCFHTIYSTAWRPTSSYWSLKSFTYSFFS